jgi:peptidyl-prolyl cis-trans isomerase A (cyclophilin A)
VAGLLFACARRLPLLAPTPADLAQVGPDSFLVELATTRGTILLAAHRDWSPLGVDRLHFLVTQGYYDGARFFRMIPGFVVQWGISANPAVSAVWDNRDLPDEPVRRSNTRGMVSYARGGPNTRGVQLYVNLGNNARLDTTSTFGFPPIAEVREGMGVADSMYAGYNCARGSQGTCPSQDSISAGGEKYLERAYPRLDRILRARVVRAWVRGVATTPQRGG